MKTLLYKQLRLVCHPMTPVFCLFGAMLLIPNYPYSVTFFYVTLGLFFTFLNMREQKDIYYSALLPIRKRDTVRAAVVPKPVRTCSGMSVASSCSGVRTSIRAMSSATLPTPTTAARSADRSHSGCASG